MLDYATRAALTSACKELGDISDGGLIDIKIFG
jgi:hypothetical protein